MKILFVIIMIWLYNQAKILLRCHGMYKTASWSDNYFLSLP